MVTNGYEIRSGEVQSTETPKIHKINTQIPLYVSTSQKGLCNHSDPEIGFQDINTRSLPSRLKLLKFSSSDGFSSPLAKFRQLAKERDEFSQSVPFPTGHSFRDRLDGALSKQINWNALWETSKEWIRSPFNMALLLWIICVAISGAILFLVMTGMLNKALPKKSQRNTWFGVNNQILNALFTLMCLYQHPKRFHHLVLLCRWKANDISCLRMIYCKNGTYKPHEWTHMMVVIILLHVNCFAQYALCGLNLGFKRSERPAIGVGICISFAIAAPAIASIYSILSPIGREYELEIEDVEGQEKSLKTDSGPRVKSMERRFSFSLRKNDKRVVEIENNPEWKGGLFDFWNDITVSFLSLFCTFCVFGWNMERLGFGNMYVHIATFLLFCMAPFWIFNLAAFNIDNEIVREALGVTGIVLCVFGLLYGGFWRIQMRKRFNLPSENRICGEPAVGDCAQWLFCCWCSLAQEVRTADYYDIIEDKFCRKQRDVSTVSHEIEPLPHESYPSSPLFTLATEESLQPSRFFKDHHEVEAAATDDGMMPPVPSVIEREDK